MQSVRVLLVAYNPAFSHAVTELLSYDDRVAEVSAVQTAHAALGQMQTWQPDVVLLDLWLPDMNWLEATRRLKARPHAPQVVLMTMDFVNAYRDAAVAVQLDGVLDKTNFAEEFGAFLSALLEEGGPNAIKLGKGMSWRKAPATKQSLF
ncbi:MAG: response regulator [Candidatus Binatia bacterium]